MKRSGLHKFYRGLLLIGLLGAGMGLVGCADEYAAYPGYHGGYYASYAGGGYPYYGGYGYPYRAYGPYPYYGGPYYGYSPYYGGASVVVSSRTYSYRDQYGRLHYSRRTGNRVRKTTRTTTAAQTRSTTRPRYENDDERRYYTPR